MTLTVKKFEGKAPGGLVKIKIIAGTVIGGMGRVKVNEIVTAPAKDARFLISTGKAIPVEEPAEKVEIREPEVMTREPKTRKRGRRKKIDAD